MFEKKIESIQMDMLNLAMELTKGKVDAVYIYAAKENNFSSFNSFFLKDGRLYRLGQLSDIGIEVPDAIEFKYLELGNDDFLKMLDVLEEYGQDIPTQMKLMYSFKTKKLSGKFDYELHFSNSDTLTSRNIFEQWFEEEKAKLENK